MHIAQMAVSLILLSSIGLTLIVTKSYLFKSIRLEAKRLNLYLGKFLACSMCFGFWSVFICYYLYQLVPIINYCFIGSLLSYTYTLIFNKQIEEL